MTSYLLITIKLCQWCTSTVDYAGCHTFGILDTCAGLSRYSIFVSFYSAIYGRQIQAHNFAKIASKI